MQADKSRPSPSQEHSCRPGWTWWNRNFDRRCRRPGKRRPATVWHEVSRGRGRGRGSRPGQSRGTWWLAVRLPGVGVRRRLRRWCGPRHRRPGPGELGVMLFDTAEVYGFGRSERILTEALGADRSEVVAASKGLPVAPFPASCPASRAGQRPPVMQLVDGVGHRRLLYPGFGSPLPQQVRRGVVCRGMAGPSRSAGIPLAAGQCWMRWPLVTVS